MCLCCLFNQWHFQFCSLQSISPCKEKATKTAKPTSRSCCIIRQIPFRISYIEDEIIVFDVVILLVLQSLLPKMSNGDVITCLIFILMMTHMGTLVLPSVVLMAAVFHSFVYPTIYHLTSSDIVILTTYVRHLMPVKIYVHLSVGATRNMSLLFWLYPHICMRWTPGIQE